MCVDRHTMWRGGVPCQGVSTEGEDSVKSVPSPPFHRVKLRSSGWYCGVVRARLTDLHFVLLIMKIFYITSWNISLWEFSSWGIKITFCFKTHIHLSFFKCFLNIKVKPVSQENEYTEQIHTLWKRWQRPNRPKAQGSFSKILCKSHLFWSSKIALGFFLKLSAYISLINW